MTQEQINAFQNWWNKSSIGCDKGTVCRDAFASGWEAAVNRPLKVDVNRATAFETWWAHSGVKLFCSETTAQWVWDSAWTNATISRTDEQAARQIEREDIERRLLAMACHAFLAGNDEHAHWFRSLVNALFKKLGDTSA